MFANTTSFTLNPRSRTLVLTGLAVAAAVTLAIAAVRPAAAEDRQSPEVAAGPSDLESKALAASAAYEFDEAAALLRDALEARKQQFGENSIEYARGLAKLGALNATWDRSKDAAEYYAKALPLLERHLGANDPELFAPLRFLALDAQVREDIPQAESFYQRAVEIQRSNHIAGPDAALALNDLAILKLGKGDLSSASQLLDEALAAVPKDSPERAAAFTTRAEVLHRLGRGAEADNAFAAALRLVGRSVQAPVTRGEGVLQIGPGVSGPRPLVRGEPEYSAEAHINKLQGTVKFSVVIGADGHVRDLRVTQSLGLGLDQKAAEAVQRWRFGPARKDGQPVSVMAFIEIRFKPNRDQFTSELDRAKSSPAPTPRQVEVAGPTWSQPKNTLPDFSLVDMDGKRWKLAELRGRAVLINVWATWCLRCHLAGC
jgi:TonB family protein